MHVLQKSNHTIKNQIALITSNLIHVLTFAVKYLPLPEYVCTREQQGQIGILFERELL